MLAEGGAAARRNKGVGGERSDGFRMALFGARLLGG